MDTGINQHAATLPVQHSVLIIRSCERLDFRKILMKMLTQSVPCFVPTSPVRSPAQPDWLPKEVGTKMVMLGTMLGGQRQRRNPGKIPWVYYTASHDGEGSFPGKLPWCMTVMNNSNVWTSAALAQTQSSFVTQVTGEMTCLSPVRLPCCRVSTQSDTNANTANSAILNLFCYLHGSSAGAIEQHRPVFLF